MIEPVKTFFGLAGDFDTYVLLGDYNMTVELVSALLDRINELEAELKNLRPQTAALLKPIQGKGSDVKVANTNNVSNQWFLNSQSGLQSSK